MGITIMVQTKKEFIIIPKCTIAMLSNPHGHFFQYLLLPKKKIKKKILKREEEEEEEEAKPNTLIPTLNANSHSWH